MREDVVNADEALAKHIMSHSAKSEDNYFIVPQIIE